MEEDRKILVLGSLNMDALIEASRIPSSGETILGERCSFSPGGKGANQSFAAGRLGGEVAMIGSVGKDSYGGELKRNLKLAGVDTSGIREIPDVSTGMAFILLEPSGENRIVVVQGANQMSDEAAVAAHREMIKNCDILMLQMEIPLEANCLAAEVARQYGKTVILDPSPIPEEMPDRLLACVDVIKPNETELSMLTGKSTETAGEIVEASRSLIKRGVRNVLTTWGSRGAVLVSENGWEYFPARRVEAVDTTAAGDSFIAAFACRFNGNNYSEAVRFANRVAERVVQKKGAQSSIPSLEEMKDEWEE